MSDSQTTSRKPRADSARNRCSILIAAREAFTRDGASASLDDIAKTAGVGPGTLYRHFPTRDALLEAVYHDGVRELAARQHEFAETLPPLEALRSGMLLFIDYVAQKLLIAPALESVGGGSARLYESSRPQIHEAMTALVRNAIASGDLRPDVEPGDFLRMLIGIVHLTWDPEWQAAARRLVDLLIAGARTAK